MRRGTKKQWTPQIRINEYIKAPEVRVIGPEGENIGVLKRDEALEKSRELGFDLIEISPKARPPICKIMDFGKYQYDQKKKQKAQKAKAHNVEVKSVQVKIGTDEGGLDLKAKRASKWLEEGHRVKLELFLPGRTKYMEKDFLEERLDRIKKLITVNFKVAEPVKKNPKGLMTIVERDNSKKAESEE